MSLAREVLQRTFIALVAFVLVVLLARAAHAGWVEAHLTGSDTRVRMEQDGAALFDLVLTYRVAAGSLRTVDVVGLRADALDPTAEVRAEDGTVQNATVVADEKGVHLGFEGKGLKRGAWTVHLRGSVRFGAGRGLMTDGALWRLVWTSPVANEGFDGARVVFDLPAGPTEPRAVRGETPWGQSDVDARPDALGAIATLRRLADRDELELVRPHVGRGEAASWAARVDPKAFPAIADPTLRPPPAPAAPPMPARTRWGLGVALALAGAAFAAIVRAKARAAAAHGAQAWIPLSPAVVALGAGAALSLAVWLEVQERTTLAALALAAAMACGTFVVRAPSRDRAPEGGVWLALDPGEAFEASGADPFDVGGRAGRIVALLAVIALVVLARVLSVADERAPIWLALDALALVPLFVTGLRASRAPGPSADGAILEPIGRALGAEHKVLPWARTSEKDGATRELRLFVAPRPPIPGLAGIEIGVGWTASGRAWAPRIELLARVRAESAAHGRLLAWEDTRPASREPGRKADERVFRFVCEPEIALERARSLASVVVERREAERATSHADRRAPGPSEPDRAGPTGAKGRPPAKAARPFVRVAEAGVSG